MCISLKQEYFDNPKRFPYEDVTESATISKDQTGLSVFGIREKNDASNGQQKFNTNVLAAGFANIVQKVFGSHAGIVSYAFVALRNGVFITGQSGSDSDLAENTIEVLRKEWNFSDGAANHLQKQLMDLIRATPRIGGSGDSDDSDAPTDTAEPETEPKRTKAELISIVEENMIEAVKDGGFSTNGWVGDSIRTMCSIAIRSVNVGSDQGTYE